MSEVERRKKIGREEDAYHIHRQKPGGKGGRDKENKDCGEESGVEEIKIRCGMRSGGLLAPSPPSG